MLGSNIKYYRLEKNYSLRELAKKVEITPMALSYYENNLRRPNNDILSKISKSLGKDINDFLTTYDTSSNNITYEDYYLNSLSKLDKEFIDVQINDYISRYYQIIKFSGVTKYLNYSLKEKSLSFDEDIYLSSSKLRMFLNLNKFGPISLINNLELNNIICVPIKTDKEFYLSTGTTNNIRYIAYNINYDKNILYKHITILLTELFFKQSIIDNYLLRKMYVSFLLPKEELSLIQNNLNDIDLLLFISNKYSILFKDLIFYLKVNKKINNTKIEVIQKSEKIEHPFIFDFLLEQIYKMKYIDGKKYLELKKEI